MNAYTQLPELARLNSTDKYDHGYMPLYDNLFAPFRHEPVRIMEIGFAKGRGARTLAEYFPRAVIHCLDYMHTDLTGYKEQIPEDLRKRLFLWQGDQGKLEDLRRVHQAIRDSTSLNHPEVNYRLVIDDGSHIPIHQIASFNFFWKYIEPGGYYVIEDMHPSYKESKHSTMEYFYNQIHELNKKGDIKAAATSDIDWIMFPYNRIVIRKKP
jgi:hypothetical protein